MAKDYGRCHESQNRIGFFSVSISRSGSWSVQQSLLAAAQSKRYKDGDPKSYAADAFGFTGLWYEGMKLMQAYMLFILFFPIILDESKIEFSSFVKTLIDFGLQDINCFTSANPIEPVPPVTSIFLFLYAFFISLLIFNINMN